MDPLGGLGRSTGISVAMLRFRTGALLETGGSQVFLGHMKIAKALWGCLGKLHQLSFKEVCSGLKGLGVQFLIWVEALGSGV